MFHEISVSTSDADYLRQAKHNVDAATAALDEPKGLVSTLKEDTKKHGFNRNAFDAARRAANRKMPEAQGWFRTVAKCAIAWGIFDQRDIEDTIQEASDLAARNGEDPPKPEQSTAEAMLDAIEKDGGEARDEIRAAAAAAANGKAKGEQTKRASLKVHQGNGKAAPGRSKPVPVRGRKPTRGPDLPPAA